jgi:hypothetical protein
MSKNKSGDGLYGAAPPHSSDRTGSIYHTKAVSNICSADLFACRQLWWSTPGQYPAQPDLIVIRGGRRG